MIQQTREIKPVAIENVFQRALVNIIYTYHANSGHIKDRLAPFVITPQQYNVLRILKHQYPSPATINFIKSKIIDQVTDASRIVDRLIFKGFIAKKANDYDKRAVDIILTEKGMALLRKIEREVDFTTILSPNLSEDEAVQLCGLLEKLMP